MKNNIKNNLVKLIIPIIIIVIFISGYFLYRYFTNSVDKQLDKIAPIVSFGQNGNLVAAKSYSTMVNVSDTGSGLNINSLKYQWTTSPSTPSASSFGLEFSNGFSINTPEDSTGNYYLWIYAEDNDGNVVIEKSNAFVLNNTNEENIRVTFEPNGSKYATKTYSIDIFIGTDNNKSIKLKKYQWTTSNTEPTKESFTKALDLTESVISTPANVTGDYYLWLYVEDVDGNYRIMRSESFKLSTANSGINITNLSGKYIGTAYMNEGTKPWIEFKADKKFEMLVNVCEGLINLSGSYVINDNRLLLNLVNNDTIGYNGVEGIKFYQLMIKNNNELIFLHDAGCGPQVDSIFTKQ